ncbi:MAG: restriction endonuclease subunit S [Thiogranum sp.]
MRNVPLMSLAEVAESVRYGYTASASDSKVGPKFLRITDIVPPQIDWPNVPYCKIDEKDLDKYSLESGDIVVARTGATVGYAKLIRGSEPSVFASYLVRIRVDPEKADPGYVGRIVESEVYKRFVLSRVGGAAQPNANAKVLSSFRLPIPEQATQRRIASILSAYDDLIENNRRRIQLLEQAARLLYKEWFVHLRFPGHEHVKIKDGVPEGWEKKPLGEVAPLKYGKALKNDDRTPGPYPVYGSSGVIGAHNKALVSGPAIIVGRKGNVGSVYWSEDDFHPIDTVYFVDGEKCNLHLYYALIHTPFINTDVAVPGLNRDFAHSRPLLIPESKILRLFEEIASPIHEQIVRLEKYTGALAEARDLLLPRLMNGEITV